METKTKKEHWREIMGKTYLVGEVLNGKEVTLTISEAGKEPVVDVQESKKQRQEVLKDQLVLHFKGTEYKLILNVINAKSISKELKSPYPEDWVNKQITLRPIKEKFFGELQEAIRIKQDFSQTKV